jgi:aminodeoxyfutalosine deaminase
MSGTAIEQPVTGLSDDELIAMAKADLHVHLVGSAAPHTVAALAARHPRSGVPADADQLAAFFAFRDFTHFLKVYTAVSELIRTAEDLVTLVTGLAADMRAQGTAYAEVTVTPMSHTRAGISAGELAAALDAGAAAAHVQGVELAWVYDISGGDGREGAQQTLDAALNHPPAALIGFGLGGPEAGVQRASFRDEFATARAAGLHSLPHAGESVGAREVWAAIDELGAERIGHGIAAADDPVLLDRLREERITLEVCPSSNVATGVVRSLAAHPLPLLLAAGVPVVLGSDDPPMFNTSLVGEYRRVRDHFGLTAHQLRALARASIEASFAPAFLKAQLLTGCDGAGSRADAGRGMGLHRAVIGSG